MRYSRQKEIIKKEIKGRFDHPTADDIYVACRKVEPSISLGTIYRNLKVLSEEGVIETLETVDKKLHYDGREGVHSHFICEKCGKIHDIMGENYCPTSLGARGFKVKTSKSVYYGLCPQCLK